MQALSIKDSISDLLPIIRKNATAQSVVVYLAERSRHRTDTDLKRLKYDMYHAGFMLDDNDYISFWEELSKTEKVGTFIRATVTEKPVMNGKRQATKDGKPLVTKDHKAAKFHWKFSCKAFGQEMLRMLREAGVNPMQHSTSLAKLDAEAKKSVERGLEQASNRKFAKDPRQAKATAAIRITAGKAKVFIPEGITKAEAAAISKKLFALVK